MSEPKIAIILGSTRPGRNGKAVADWMLAKASRREAPLLSLAHEAVSLCAEASATIPDHRHENGSPYERNHFFSPVVARRDRNKGTAALIWLWVKPFQYSLKDISYGSDLIVEQVDKVSTNGVGMRGCSVSNRPAPLIGELDHGSAGIVGARASADESPLAVAAAWTNTR